MKGQILDFSIQTNTGYISGDDGKRYHFSGQEWKDNKAPVKGGKVDFDISPSGEAIQIYVVGGQGIEGLAQNFDQQVSRIINNDGKDESQYTMIDWFVKCLKNYANFSGRARRKEYWFFVLMQFIILMIAMILDSILFSGPSFFYSVVALGLFIPSLAAGVRRMHDTGRSGWLLLISLIPLVGLLVIFWLASETELKVNKWGNPTK
jgi:uncharacterized membrane protein YhaH (DUF805 family)/YHS domain-containing protein